jgi:uncharacterized protein YndB with AHSA1/START domain
MTTADMETSEQQVGLTNFSTPTDREIVIERMFDAPRGFVFEAWTNPQHLPNWMLGPEGWTMPVCEVDLQPGGEWRFVWRDADGREMGMRGVYQEVTPPARLVYTESWGGDWAVTVNTLVLVEADGRTTITCSVRYPSKDARDRALKTGMSDGVARSFDRLAGYLQTLEPAESTL